MGTHVRVLSESYLMNTHMIQMVFKKTLREGALDKSSLGIGKVNIFMTQYNMDIS